jgi:hypothetical protein
MFASLDGLTELGSRNGVDMRPTLLRVLTDLYVQKRAHTAEEDRHYTELALRLIEAVDVTARIAVAERLGGHPAPPEAVVARLARDLPAVSETLWRAEHHAAIAGAAAASRPASTGQIWTPAPAQDTAAAAAKEPAGQARAHELNELFLGADAGERRLILLNLEVLAPPTQHTGISRDPHACQRLEAAALSHDVEQFVQHLARTLRIAHALALRLVRDESGEPVVVAAKVLKMPPEVLQRILLFLNPTVGHSVARVHALAELYEEMTVPAAEQLLAIWQALPRAVQQTVGHRPLLWDDDPRQRPREPLAERRGLPFGRAPPQRRNAS